MNGDFLYRYSFDLIEDGVIVVDKQRIIRIYNRRAREIFGISCGSGPGHAAGTIAVGDIVILGDNCLGGDDGGLGAEDLSRIGLPPGELRPGDAFVAAGKYDRPEERACCHIVRGGQLQEPLDLECAVDGLAVRVEIDDFSKCSTITVGDKSYRLGYLLTVANLVVLDGATGEVKFYQARGYTARGEAAGDLLRGGRYLAKGPDAPALALVGEPVEKVHPANEGMHCLDLVLNGSWPENEWREYVINGMWVRFSACPIYGGDGQIAGGALIFRDISELKLLEQQGRRNPFKYPAFQKVIGRAPELMECVKIAQKVSGSKSTVLLLGESGTGKGLFARAIHDNSPRAAKPFITVNLASIPSTLLESELFGYEKGAFTGAKTAGEIGKLRLADGGTLFLDEMGELDYYLQAKLLHVLQDNAFYPVGSSRPTRVDVRFIVATNRDLEQEVKGGKFREDLYYRMNVIAITLPPLRSRKEDIGELVERLIPGIGLKVGRKGLRVSAEVLALFQAYEWPGNVRELENVLERAANLAEGELITAEVLPGPIRGGAGPKTGRAAASRFMGLRDYRAAMERDYILQALQETGGDKAAAMKKLGIGKSAFYEKLKQLDIQFIPSIR
ncbi:MAG TPA: sigma 54-interacting transcriptional regulator [Selenomonadales bacterium]|nr:sigma 54-interacting transcriptional regulator [Selenomonadales bacterium]